MFGDPRQNGTGTAEPDYNTNVWDTLYEEDVGKNFQSQ